MHGKQISLNDLSWANESEKKEKKENVMMGQEEVLIEKKYGKAPIALKRPTETCAV